MELLERRIQAAQNGDSHAFALLMEQYHARVFAVALVQLGNYHHAEDATQEAFVEAYLRLHQLQTPSAFGAWLRKIVMGKCVRAIRGGKSVAAPVSLDELLFTASGAFDPQTVLLQHDTRRTLEREIAGLSEQEREAFLLFAIGGYTYAEIAEQMALPLTLVKKRIYTARQQLRGNEQLAALRPLSTTAFAAKVNAKVQKRQHEQRKEFMSTQTSQIGSQSVSLLGPGPECKTAVLNLYAFYRYELLLSHHYADSLTPPPSVTPETWYSGAWVNQHGVINGLHSQTHDEAVGGEHAFWEWPNLQAYLIQLNGWPAGFACVASPPNATRGVDYRLQELFVINKARRIGVASAAMRLLFDQLPGKWELAYDPKREPAANFWRKFLPDYTAGDFTEEMIGMGDCPDWPGYVFTKGPRPTHPIKVR